VFLIIIFAQEEAECIVGRDYPKPMIDHDKAVAKNSKENIFAYCRRYWFIRVLKQNPKSAEFLSEMYI